MLWTNEIWVQDEFRRGDILYSNSLQIKVMRKSGQYAESAYYEARGPF